MLVIPNSSTRSRHPCAAQQCRLLSGVGKKYNEGKRLLQPPSFGKLQRSRSLHACCEHVGHLRKTEFEDFTPFEGRTGRVCAVANAIYLDSLLVFP